MTSMVGEEYTVPPQRKRREIAKYAAVVLGTTIVLATCFAIFHVTSNWAANALMFIPGGWAAIFLLRSQRFRSVGWGPGNLSSWLWAILLPIIVIGVSLAFWRWAGYAAAAPASSSAARLAGDPIKLLLNMLLYVGISIPLAFGEELGWRGYAQPTLTREFGLVNGLLLLGLLWGFWHSPIYYVMRVYPSHPILGSFVMTPIDNILAVVPMAWFYSRSKSIWVPTFVHAFADVLWGFSDLLYPKTHEVQAWAILEGVQLVVSLILLIKLRSDEQGESALREAPAGV